MWDDSVNRRCRDGWLNILISVMKSQLPYYSMILVEDVQGKSSGQGVSIRGVLRLLQT